MKGKHAYVRWAIDVIESYVKNGKAPEIPEDIPHQLLELSAGVFVTLHGPNGELRGCIGTFMPAKDNLALEIRDNAIAAATKDPRFNAVTPGELEDITVNVDVLTSPVEVDTIDELDPRRYGVIVQSGFKRGLLLPDIEGVDTVEQQLNIAKRKASIFDDEPVKIFKFEVNRYH